MLLDCFLTFLRRDIRVFSANLAVLTVPHGTDKPSSGPEILLSYHDNDHYNSVRLTRPPKLVAPIRTFVKADQESSSGERDDKQEATMNVDYPDQDTAGMKFRSAKTSGQNDSATVPPGPSGDAQKDETVPIARRQLTRNAKCPCNSGKKYRRCCYATERQKLKVANTPLGLDRIVGDVDDDVDGHFRVLHI